MRATSGGGSPEQTQTHPPVSAQRELGLALYRLRLERGLSLRALARQLDYSAHSVFVDVEKGQRLPSESLVSAYERCFELPVGSLLRLRQKALVERADLLTDALGRTLDPPPAPAPPPGPQPAPTLAALLAAAVVRLPLAAIDLLKARRHTLK